MTRYASQTTVPGGYYIHPSTLSIHAVDGAWGRLPGEPGTAWVRLPLPLMLVAAAVMSLGFVIFLPVVGFVLALRFGAAPVLRALRRTWARATRALSRVLPPISPRV